LKDKAMENLDRQGLDDNEGTASRPLKISEMIIEVARDYIGKGKNMDEKQSYLDVVVSAWNISLLREKHREKALTDHLEKYRSQNPDQEPDHISALREDMLQLIQRKNRLFPDVKRLIIGANIVDEQGEERIAAASTLPVGI
jgi:hypothetical protein